MSSTFRSSTTLTATPHAHRGRLCDRADRAGHRHRLGLGCGERRSVAEFTTEIRGGMMQRMGMVIGLKPEKIAEYKRLHAAVWPDILAMISACNIRNYSIFLQASRRTCLFGYLGVSRHGFRGRHGQDGCRSEDPGMVGGVHALPGAAGDAQGRRVVGDDGRGVPSSTEGPYRSRFDPAALQQSWPLPGDAAADRHLRRRLASSAMRIFRPTGKAAFRSPALYDPDQARRARLAENGA